jgi:hypothetical protein
VYRNDISHYKDIASINRPTFVIFVLRNKIKNMHSDGIYMFPKCFVVVLHVSLSGGGDRNSFQNCLDAADKNKLEASGQN